MYFRVLQTVRRNDVCPRVVAVVCCPQIHVCTIHHIPKIYMKCITFRIVTARKWSLGQGNMFTGVCLSTGGCLLRGGACSRGVPAWGGACSRGVWSHGGGCSGGCLVETPNGYCCGRYASYWNAFLLNLKPQLSRFNTKWLRNQFFGKKPCFPLHMSNVVTFISKKSLGLKIKKVISRPILQKGRAFCRINWKPVVFEKEAF